MDDLSPIDDRDGRQVCLQLSLNLLPVVFVVVHLVIAHHIEVQ